MSRIHFLNQLGIFALATASALPALAQNRPQTPEPPFPYNERNISFKSSQDADAITIAGTLVTPHELADGVESLGLDGKFPCVIMITGSGPQDRDETIVGHKPFAVIADHLARRGIASLRCDDRGVGLTGGVLFDATVQDFAADIIASVRYCAGQDDIDASRIVLLGHSEGGLTAPMAAVQLGDEVAGVVLLAGLGVTGQELLTMQASAMLGVAGVPADEIATQMKAQDVMLSLIISGASQEEINAGIGRLARMQMGLPAEGEIPEQQAALIETVVAQQGAMVQSPWFRSFISAEPTEYLAKLACPVLALGGSLDLQVPPAQNLPKIEKALRDGGNEQVSTRTLEGLNHLFQEAATGLPTEYAAIEQTFAPQALDIISTWLTEQLALQ